MTATSQTATSQTATSQTATSQTATSQTATSQTLQIDANVDDMDPRLWPHVIAQLLATGALDVWVTPIIMKKGRPAFTLSALCEQDRAEAVRTMIFRETSTIGLRERSVERHVLDREISTVEVQGQPVRVKTASRHEEPINRSVEWEDVVAAATTLGLSAKDVLAAATALARDD